MHSSTDTDKIQRNLKNKNIMFHVQPNVSHMSNIMCHQSTEFQKDWTGRTGGIAGPKKIYLLVLSRPTKCNFLYKKKKKSGWKFVPKKCTSFGTTKFEKSSVSNNIWKIPRHTIFFHKNYPKVIFPIFDKTFTPNFFFQFYIFYKDREIVT